MKKIVSHSRFWLICGLLAADGLLFGLTDPHEVPSLLLAGGFVLLLVTLYQLFLVALAAAGWYGLPGGTHRQRQARVLTGVFGGLIGLQSVGELGIRDVLVLLPLAVIAYLYISYGKSQAKNRADGAAGPSVATVQTSFE